MQRVGESMAIVAVSMAAAGKDSSLDVAEGLHVETTTTRWEGRELTGKWQGVLKTSKPTPSGHTFSDKATPPNPSQTVHKI